MNKREGADGKMQILYDKKFGEIKPLIFLQ